MLAGVAACLTLALSTARSSTEGDLDGLLQKFEKVAEDSRREAGIPGMSIAIVQNDAVIYSKGFGVKKLGGTDPVDPNTIFQIGSTSKAFTSALMAILVEDKLIKWSDRVVDVYPAFQTHDPYVTQEFVVEDLMAQRSGMPGYALTMPAFLGFGREHIVDSIRYIYPETSFRLRYAYQNCFFLVAAQIQEAITGKSWEQNLRERIWQEAGMSQTSASWRAYSDSANHSWLHITYGDKVIPVAEDNPYLGWPYIYGPAGGINSTALNMAKWLRVHLNGGTIDGRRIMKKSSVDSLHQPHTIMSASSGALAFYCQAWVSLIRNGRTYIWHNGDTNISHAMVAMLPEEDLGIVILCNLGDTEVPDSLAFEFFNMYLEEKGETATFPKFPQMSDSIPIPPAASRPAAVGPARGADAYTGSYSNPIYGVVTVSKRGNGLDMVMGPWKIGMAMAHVTGDTFALSWPGLYKDLGNVYFHVNGTGKAESFYIQVLSADGGGEFDRVGD